ncbi:MAG: GNAT family N-acetyltransferase [Bacteroidia bacterium]
MYQRLRHLEGAYPGFRQWFWGQVVPGVNQGSRVIATLSRESDDFASIAILKNSVAEKKICTLWVAPEFRACGLASRLIEHAFDLLSSERPLITVASERLSEFERPLAKFGFQLEQTYPNYYRTGSTEYAFNGPLSIDALIH